MPISAANVTPLRIALFCRHPLAEDILSNWLNGILADCDVTPVTAVAALASSGRPFDITILGSLFDDAPSIGVIEALDELQAVGLATPTVVVSDRVDGAFAAECILRGARGFIPTSSTVSVAAAALRLVLTGGTYVPRAALFSHHGRSAEDGPSRPAPPAAVPISVVATDPAPTPRPPLPANSSPFSDGELTRLGLSPREGQILFLVQLGRSNRIIASTLEISENTVMVHIRNLMRKLAATNRTQAVFNAKRRLDQGEEEPAGGALPAAGLITADRPKP